MLSFLPPDVALVLSSAIRRGRTAELSVERPGQRASAEDYGTALALIARYADHLASMPPPQDQKDDVGYSAATDRPMREYLEQVGEFGAESLPAETHFRAASMLLIHGKKQLPGDEIRALRDVIKTHIEREGRTAPPEKGAGAYAVADPKQGNVKNQGTYTWGRPRGAQNTLYIHLSPTLWKAGIRVGDILQAVGLERRVHWDFHKEPGTYADITYLAVPAAHIGKVMSALREVIPDLSTEILANLPLYRKMSGLSGQEEARPTARQAPAASAPPPVQTAQTYDARKGEVALPRPPGRDWFLPAWKPFSWSWNPDEPETAMLGIPAAWWSPDKVKIPVHGKAIGDARVVVRRGPPPDYLTEVPVNQIPALAAALAGVRGGIYAEAVPLLADLHRMWVGAAHQAESERRTSVTGDEVRLATRLARRFKHAVAEGITEADLRDALVNNIDVLRRVLPGDLMADVGVHGSWVVRAKKEKVEKKDKTIGYVVREYVGLSLPYERGIKTLREVVGAKPEKTPSGWVSWIPMRKVSAAARALDPVNPVVAMTLRIALLTDADVKICPELDALAKSFKIDEIPDDPHLPVAEQVRRLSARADLRARRRDADGNIVEDRPFEYQMIGMAYAHFADGRTLIGDAPGLGKTVQAIGYAKLNPNAFPVIVVAPSNATFNWKIEFERWLPGVDASVVEAAKDPIPKLGKQSVRIFTYAMFRTRIEEILRLGFRLAIFDESHNLKHSGSTQSTSAGRLARSIPHILLLSGTSMENRIPELWHQLHLLSPESFPSFAAFAKKYGSKNKRVVSVRDLRGDPETIGLLDELRDADGALVREFDEDRQSASIEELTDALRCFMVRRTKQEVLATLPEKTRKVLRLQGLDLKAYHLAEKEMPALLSAIEKRARARAVAELLLESPDSNRWRHLMAELNAQPFTNPSKYVLVQLGRLRQLVGAAKVGAAVSWIQDFRHRTRRPLLVFAEHGEVIKSLSAALKALGITHRTVTGETSSRLKSEAVADFQDGKYDVLIASRALREAVTLHRAADVLFVEWWWVPAQMEQAEDRVYRIGQTKNVTIYLLSAPGTIDDDMEEMVEKKRELVEEVIGADEYEEDREKHEMRQDDLAAQEVGASLLERMKARVRDSAGVQITEADVAAARDEILDARASGGKVTRGKRK